MTYNEATGFLFSQLPMFQSLGPGAYKPGLDTSRRLDAMTGHPHRRFRIIHIAGTNGKGSTAHSLAAVLMAAGYRVGLYTSPHLLDFRERIKVNGRMIPEERVVSFVERFRDAVPELAPTFFELTTAMAFEYFADENVDYAVIECGLGGRLDSTNIITPELSVITNISLDHTSLLGDTRAAIASEKAGIIKPGVPVVIGEADDEIRPVYDAKASETGSEIIYACDNLPYASYERESDRIIYRETPWGDIACDLTGECQPRNMATVLTALGRLDIPAEAVREGLAKVASSTGLMGRWMKFGDSPLRICDTGHNAGGWEYLARQIGAHNGRKRIVLGFVSDKELDPVMTRLREIGDVSYYFTHPSVKRARPVGQLAEEAAAYGLTGETFDDVASAYRRALADSAPGDLIFVGGSTFVVADLLAFLKD